MKGYIRQLPPFPKKHWWNWRKYGVKYIQVNILGSRHYREYESTQTSEEVLVKTKDGKMSSVNLEQIYL